MRTPRFFDRVPVACAAALSSVAVACAPLGAANDAAVPVHDAATFYDTTSISSASFSTDGKRLLVTSDESGTFNAYAVDLATGERTALTRSTTDAIFAIDWFPDDDRFLYTADQGGNELNHLYVQAPDGRVVDLTPGERAKAGFQGWAGDGRSFFVTTNERDPRFFDVHRYWIEAPVAAVVGAPYPRETLYRNDVGFNVQDVSRDEFERLLHFIYPSAATDVARAVNRVPLRSRYVGRRIASSVALGTSIHAIPHRLSQHCGAGDSCGGAAHFDHAFGTAERGVAGAD
jgi:hypothetical protein